MSERVRAYVEMVQGLSSEGLDRSARELAVREKRDGARLIAHIAEIGERRYHLELGYASLFEFCVKRLNLSEGAVYRRTQVAGVCRQFPQILEALSGGRLHITGASLIAPHLTEDNVESLIAMVQGKTKREVEAFLVTLAPKETFAPSIRKRSVRNPLASEGAEPEEEPRARSSFDTAQSVRPGSDGQRTRDLLELATEARYNFRFSAGADFTEKFTRLAEVLGIESPHTHLEEIFDLALESALDKKDPKRKLERRRKREAKKETPRDPRPGEAATKTAKPRHEDETAGSGSESPAVTRYIPSEVRERVLERAGYRCQYRSPDGARCSSRTGLEVEHTKPFAVWRTHDERYLQAFCPAHNEFAAEEFYGRKCIRQKIDAGRHEKAERSRVRQSAPIP